MNPLSTFTAGHVSVSVFGNKKAETVIYIPIPVTEVMETAHLTEEFPLLLAFIDGMDWNRDLSPWPARKYSGRRKIFRGKRTISWRSLQQKYFQRWRAFPNVRRKRGCSPVFPCPASFPLRRNEAE